MGLAEKVWLLLAALTLASAWLAESGHAGWPLVSVVAALIAVKTRLVIDHYMGISRANPRIRRALYAFTIIVPLLVLASHGWSEMLRRLTALG